MQREEEEKIRRDRIAKGLPVRYDEKGEAVYVCAYPGCETELLPGTSITWSRSLPFCSQLQHSW
jgi:hypothetical protein